MRWRLQLAAVCLGCLFWTSWVTAQDVPPTISAENAAHLVTTQTLERAALATVYSLRFADDNTMVVGYFDDTITWWDVASGQVLVTQSGIFPIAQPGGARYLGEDPLTLYSSDGEPLTRITDEGPTGMAFNEEGSLLAVTFNDARVVVYTLAGDVIEHETDYAHDSQSFVLTQAAFSPENDRLVVGGAQYNTTRADIWLLELSGPERIARYRGETNTRPASLAYSPRGESIAFGTAYGQVIVLDRALEEVGIVTLDESASEERYIFGVTFSPDGSLIVAGSDSGTVWLLDADTLEIITALQGHTDRIRGLAFSPDGTQLASGGLDGIVRVWALPDTSESLSDDESGDPVLEAGGRARTFTTDGDDLRMRAGAGRGFEVVAELPDGTEVTVIGGPIPADELTWWNIRLADGMEGWVVEAVDGIQTLVPLGE